MKLKRWAHHFLGITLLLLFLTGSFSAAFFLTDFIYTQTGYTLPVFSTQMITFFLALVILFLIVKVIGKFDTHTTGLFGSVIDTQKQIARGNFDIKMDKDIEGDETFGELIDSVNYMAFELNKIEQMRQEFISNISHEIQSPLTSIRGFAHTLRNDQLTSEQKSHYLDIIETESIRLSQLSDNLLRLASLEADTFPFAPTLYRLDKQLRSAILACEPQWSEKNIQMIVSLKNIAIPADAEMMNQVWTNLLNNSIKFTPTNGSITVSLHQHSDTTTITISDTGIGIAEEDQQAIFDRFFKADKSRKSSLKGSGLGLSIVKKIIDMHHGTITVQSTLGIGTTFTISLPYSITPQNS